MNWLETWAELYTASLLVLGLAVSLIIDAAVVSYAVIFISGILVGRLYHIRKHKLGFPFFLIILGYMAGYLAGSIINRRGHWSAIIILFWLGCLFGDYIMEKKYCK